MRRLSNADGREAWVKAELTPGSFCRLQKNLLSLGGYETPLFGLRSDSMNQGILAIVLNSRNAQSRQSIAIDRPLPGQKLFDR